MISDIYCVWAVIDVDAFDTLNEKYGQQGAKRKMDQIDATNLVIILIDPYSMLYIASNNA